MKIGHLKSFENTLPASVADDHFDGRSLTPGFGFFCFLLSGTYSVKLLLNFDAVSGSERCCQQMGASSRKLGWYSDARKSTGDILLDICYHFGLRVLLLRLSLRLVRLQQLLSNHRLIRVHHHRDWALATSGRSLSMNRWISLRFVNLCLFVLNSALSYMQLEQRFCFQSVTVSGAIIITRVSLFQVGSCLCSAVRISVEIIF